MSSYIRSSDTKALYLDYSLRAQILLQSIDGDDLHLRKHTHQLDHLTYMISMSMRDTDVCERFFREILERDITERIARDEWIYQETPMSRTNLDTCMSMVDDFEH